MERYKQLAGNTGVAAFEIGDDHIMIEFADGTTYLYNYQSAGKENIEKMKALALKGKGLTTFINRTVKKRYAKKLK